jgi:hypothetical protein
MSRVRNPLQEAHKQVQWKGEKNSPVTRKKVKQMMNM